MSIPLATYESSRGHGLQYNVIRGDDGVIYCNCPGWKNRRNCKHLLDYTVNNAKNAVSVDNDIKEALTSNVATDGDQKSADAVSIAISMMKG